MKIKEDNMIMKTHQHQDLKDLIKTLSISLVMIFLRIKVGLIIKHLPRVLQEEKKERISQEK